MPGCSSTSSTCREPGARAEYQRADLVAFPTLGDGFGLVIQEAMCSRTPVVTTPAGGGPECITHGQDGWIVPAGDVDALVETFAICAAIAIASDSAGCVGARARRAVELARAGDDLMKRSGRARQRDHAPTLRSDCPAAV